MVRTLLVVIAVLETSSEDVVYEDRGRVPASVLERRQCFQDGLRKALACTDHTLSLSLSPLNHTLCRYIRKLTLP